MATPTVGIHIACHLIGGSDSDGKSTLALPGKCLWSKTMATEGTHDNQAPSSQSTAFIIQAFDDVWVSIGPEPYASKDPGSRRLMRAGDEYTQQATPGDKVNWVKA